MEELGQKLRRAREARGVALRDIASKTKVSVTALEALERSEFNRLPGGIFSRALVRAYAVEVGLDPDTTVENFLSSARKSEQESAEREAAIRGSVTSDDREFLERQRRALGVLRVALIVVAAGAVAFLVWQLRPFWDGESEASEAAPTAAAVSAPPPPSSVPRPVEPPPSDAPPVVSEPSIPAPGAAAVAGPAPAGAQTDAAPGASVETPQASASAPERPTSAPADLQAARGTGQASTSEEAGAAPAGVPVPAATAAEDETSSAAAAAAAGSAATPLVIELIGLTDSEVRIVRDGGMVDRRILRAGQRQRLTADREIDLTVEDAAAVRWLINGRRAEPLGEAGSSVRVQVTPANAGEFLP